MVESPFFYELLKTKNLSPEKEKLATDYHENGYVVLSNIFPESLIDAVQNDTEKKAFDMSYPIKTFRNEHRVQDFWRVSESCQQLASY